MKLYYDAAYGLLFICAGLSIGYFDAYEVTKPFAPWILVKRDDAVWLSLRKKRINTSD